MANNSLSRSGNWCGGGISSNAWEMRCSSESNGNPWSLVFEEISVQVFFLIQMKVCFYSSSTITPRLPAHRFSIFIFSVTYYFIALNWFQLARSRQVAGVRVAAFRRCERELPLQWPLCQCSAAKSSSHSILLHQTAKSSTHPLSYPQTFTLS